MELKLKVLTFLSGVTLVACGGEDFSALRSSQSSFNSQKGSADADAQVVARIDWQFECELTASSNSTEVNSDGSSVKISGLGPFQVQEKYDAAEIKFSGEICLPTIIPSEEEVLVLIDAGAEMAEVDPFEEGASCGRQNLLSKVESLLAEEAGVTKGRRIGLGVFTDLLWRKTAGLFGTMKESLLALNYRKSEPSAERFCASAPGAADWRAIAKETSKFFDSFAAKEAKRRLIIVTTDAAASDGIEEISATFGADLVKVIALGDVSGLELQVGDPKFEVLSVSADDDFELIGAELFPRAKRLTVEGRGVERPTQQWLRLLDTDELDLAPRYSLPEAPISVPAPWGYELRVRSYDDAGDILNDQLGIVGWQ